LSSAISTALGGAEFSSFSLGCSYPSNLSEDEIVLLKKEFQFALTKNLEDALSKPADFKNPQLIITINFPKSKIYFHFQPIFLYGRYKKFSREIAQTFHFCYNCKGRGCDFCKGTGKLTAESVQELIAAHAVPAFRAWKDKFHGAGREDVDVLMLGNGRPFILELVEPEKRSADLKKLQRDINSSNKGKIEVSELRLASEEEMIELKSKQFEKIYSALVGCESEIDEKKLKALTGKEFKVKQKTPLRVLKRRPDMVRERKAKIVRRELLSPKKFRIDLRSEAGLYIKELISGDEGRTKTSISYLLDNRCSCLELDVIEVKEKPQC
jgi:tRNA pseudouridine synthase 10